MGHNMTRDVIKTDELEEKVQSLDLVAGRRAFIQNLGVGAVGAAVFGAAAGLKPAAAQGVTPTDVLNFALNLEYLEATFYSYAATGNDLDPAIVLSGTGAPSGPVSGGAKVPFVSPIVNAYAQEISIEETKHVNVLKYFLGSAAVARPALNIGTAFAAAAKAAGINNGAKFNAYANDTSFLLASYIFEDVGVTAYHGAAGFLMGTPYLDYAAGILAVEAYHAAIIRTSLFAAQSATVVQDTALISNLRSTLANGKPGVDDIGIGTPSKPTLVPVNAPKATQFTDLAGGDAIAYARTPGQVLKIVYGNAQATPGLFFPAGMNGTLK